MEEGFTLQELMTATAALDLFDEADAAAFAEYLFGAYDAQRGDLVQTYYDTLVNQLTGQVSQEILDNAANLANTAADSLLRTLSQSDLNLIGQTISDGLSQGLHPRAIARQLEEVQGLDANRAKSFEKFREQLANSDMTDAQIAAAEEREFQRLLKERRETIARTETAKAVSEGDRLDAVANGKKYKVWQTTGDARVSDECQANEAQGPIPIGDKFAGGVDTVPQHPNCRCSVTYVSTAAQLPGVTERAEARAERTAAAKEES